MRFLRMYNLLLPLFSALALSLTLACGGSGSGSGGNNVVDSAPSIRTQPVDLTVNSGSYASFTVSIDGSPLPTLQWEQSIDNGTTWNLIPGAVYPRYLFTVTIVDNQSKFRAVAVNKLGTITSRPATLTVLSSPSDPHPLLGSPTMISSATVGGISPQISANGYGRAVAVWEQPDSQGDEIYASEYQPEMGWSSAHQVNPDAPGPLCIVPQAMVDPSGIIDVFWSENPIYYSSSSPGFLASDIYSRRFTPGIGWSSTTQLTNMPYAGFSQPNTIASNKDGAAVLSFMSQFQNVAGGTAYCQIGTITRSVAGIWSSISILNPDLDFQATDWPRSAINDAGNAITLWGNGFGGGIISPGSIHCSQFTGGGTWSPSIEIDGMENDAPYATAIDGSSNAIALYPRMVNNNYQLYSSYYSTGSGWSSPVPVGDPQDTYITPNIAFNNAGQACAVWADSFGHVFTALFTPHTGWSSTTILKHPSYTGAAQFFPEIVATPSGEFIAVWQSETSSSGSPGNAIVCSRWSMASGWSDYAYISLPGRYALNYQGTPPFIGADGTLWVVWIDGFSANERTIWANRIPLN